jgi:5-methylcytosine-specific restriction endonuclease McrA
VGVSPLLALCSVCKGTYPQQGRSTGKCPTCFRTYERERARAKPQRRARNSAAFKKLREVAKARDGHRCRRCGSTEQLEAHELVPLLEGGNPFDLDNLVTLCAVCHRKEPGTASPAVEVPRHPDEISVG